VTILEDVRKLTVSVVDREERVLIVLALVIEFLVSYKS